MNNSTQTNWQDTKAKIKSKWSKFSDTEIEGFKDNMEKVCAQIQKTYGTGKDQAEKEYKEFKTSMISPAAAAAAAATPKPDSSGAM